MESERFHYLKKKRKSFSKTRVLGPFILLLLNSLFIYSFNLDINISIILFSLLTIFTTIICVIIAQNAISKLDKLVVKLEFHKSELCLTLIKGTRVLQQGSYSLTEQIVPVVDKEYSAIGISAQGKVNYVVREFFPKSIEKLLNKEHEK